ncbi:hypothetical protein [Entomospira culicis]|uniref:Tetratricopeptide repeat-like domain-containing protein n=1 Tax=Entomospira culicis TaxID=2719989 RepID=A0A968GHI2_9SPIO|nr:hypothetical protein [Entomospira culicis]NIZ18529.1 hypothetical protein [Entomospira culicis]NIZ68745.1 hypothetical protein [Entomospira culicis]WDI37341.1 hypothetical protein PVA46_00705 [Entomospira culicis]WDI38970.1 hypothetical protein PVA47_00715 [Entomospira culicis]
MEKTKRAKVKSRFIFGVLGLSIVLVAGVIFATNQWFAYRDEQVARIDRVIASANASPENIVVLTAQQQAELEALRTSSVKYVRNAATMLLAQYAHLEGNTAEALALYQVVAKQKRNYMAPKAQLNVAYMHLALGEREEALNALSELLRSHDVMTIDMQYEAEVLQAYLWEGDDIEHAISLYRNILSMLDRENVWYMIAQARLMHFDALPEVESSELL